MEFSLDDGSPSCDIRIDRDGVWYFRGSEMFRKDILRLFYDHLRRDAEGRYLIEIGEEKCYLDVEDTPFVIRSIDRQVAHEGGEERDRVILTLIDGREEILDPSTLRIGKDNVLYCSILNGEHEARFSRASYYDMANAFEYDQEKDSFYFSISGQRYDLRDVTQQIDGKDGGDSC
jgi:hypothetical protein